MVQFFQKFIKILFIVKNHPRAEHQIFKRFLKTALQAQAFEIRIQNAIQFFAFLEICTSIFSAIWFSPSSKEAIKLMICSSAWFFKLRFCIAIKL